MSSRRSCCRRRLLHRVVKRDSRRRKGSGNPPCCQSAESSSFASIEYRFAGTSVTVLNNLMTHALRARDGAAAVLGG
ncbi:MAG: hypothetical protein HY721_05545, partial [Planctomycetes bacterium]|nr:hypothetical protein [Planctomycetota bacterium]